MSCKITKTSAFCDKDCVPSRLDILVFDKSIRTLLHCYQVVRLCLKRSRGITYERKPHVSQNFNCNETSLGLKNFRKGKNSVDDVEETLKSIDDIGHLRKLFNFVLLSKCLSEIIYHTEKEIFKWQCLLHSTSRWMIRCHSLASQAGEGSCRCTQNLGAVRPLHSFGEQRERTVWSCHWWGASRSEHARCSGRSWTHSNQSPAVEQRQVSAGLCRIVV